MRIGSMSYFFGPHVLHNSQIFFESALSLGIVNIKPIVPGHVLIISKRVEDRLTNLTPEEYSDLFSCVRIIAPKLEKHYNAHALNVAVQDGQASGQSVPHVHVHILPRKHDDFKRNDDVYEELERQDLAQEFDPAPERRKARAIQEMADECLILRGLFDAERSCP